MFIDFIPSEKTLALIKKILKLRETNSLRKTSYLIQKSYTYTAALQKWGKEHNL